MVNRDRAVGMLCLSMLIFGVLPARAQVPSLSSRAGAAYTLYLDFGGFNFTGTWGGTGLSPGSTAAYGNAATVKDIWARVAEKYVGFNVNVTTVDPAVAAGQAGSDLARQQYYDATAKMMHTVIGSSARPGNANGWYGAAGGVSYVGVTQNAFSGSTAGWHTNWAFTNWLADGNKFIAEASTHENGHGLSLNHQSDYHLSGTNVTEYSSNGGATGNGSYAPIMGDSYDSQRGTWRVGTMNNGVIENDVATILGNGGMSLMDDGVGHSFVGATDLPLTGTAVDATLAQGFITPLTGVTPNPIGINNYTEDFFKFTMGQTGDVNLTLTNGGDWLTPGVAAAGATLRSKLNIFKAGNLLTPFATATEAINTLSSTFTGTLAAGDYYAQITSYGGYSSTFDGTAKYYDMGSYILSGSGILPRIGSAAAPEPGTLALLSVGMIGIVRFRRRK